MANVFDESDDDSDGDGEMNQVSEIARLPMDNPIWSEPGAVAVDGTSSGGGFVVDARAEINLNMNMGTAEKNKQQHRTVSLEALLRLEQQNGGRKDKDNAPLCLRRRGKCQPCLRGGIKKLGKVVSKMIAVKHYLIHPMR